MPKPKETFTIPRPSKEAAKREAEAKTNAAKLIGDEGRLSVRMQKDNVRAIHIAALKNGKSVKQFVLQACRDAGAEVSKDDVETDE